jgi:exodeoxyribonuclease-3
LIIATWNVNSIRARQERDAQWLEVHRPDVLCLQETKVLDENFPTVLFRSLGYDLATHGQKGYNGVAILARAPLQDVGRGFEDGEEESGSRFLGATVGGVRIYSVYVPNGQIVGSAAYLNKLRWLARLRAVLERRHAPGDLVVLCGDFNIAPEERDVDDPEFWKTQVLFHPTARAALRELLAYGLVDTFRLHHEAGGLYTWWDYMRLSFPKNKGLRIDHIFATTALAAHCTGASIDREARKGPSPSDHTVVTATFDL